MLQLVTCKRHPTKFHNIRWKIGLYPIVSPSHFLIKLERYCHLFIVNFTNVIYFKNCEHFYGNCWYFPEIVPFRQAHWGSKWFSSIAAMSMANLTIEFCWLVLFLLEGGWNTYNPTQNENWWRARLLHLFDRLSLSCDDNWNKRGKENQCVATAYCDDRELWSYSEEN